MSIKTLQPRTTVLILMIGAAALFRLFQSSNVLSAMSNFTPIGAMAIFGGCYFKDHWKAYIVPLVALAISDVLLNRIFYFDHWTFYYNGIAWVYASFALMVIIGQLIKKVTVLHVTVAAVAAAVFHWIVSDFGAWLVDPAYTKDMNGFLQCYILAIPFLKNMLIGNLVFSGVLFGAFEWMQRRYPSLQTAS